MKRRMIVMIMVFVLGVTFLGQNAKAWSWSGKRFSETSTSNVAKTYTTTVTLNYDTNTFPYVCGGDVKADLTLGGYRGMQDAFIKSSSRVVDVDLIEKDTGSYSMAHSYYGTFGINSAGDYCPVSWYSLYVINGSTAIENDGSVELGLIVTVYSCTGDTSTAVPAGIFGYKCAVVD